MIKKNGIGNDDVQLVYVRLYQFKIQNIFHICEIVKINLRFF